MSQITNNTPTEAELEILQILWEKGEASVRDVHDTLALTKDTGYTTTLKQMQIMFERGFISREVVSIRVHVYKALLLQEKVQEDVLNKVIKTVFSGSPTKVVIQALGSYSASDEEMKLIQDYINSLKK